MRAASGRWKRNCVCLTGATRTTPCYSLPAAACISLTAALTPTFTLLYQRQPTVQRITSAMNSRDAHNIITQINSQQYIDFDNQFNLPLPGANVVATPFRTQLPNTTSYATVIAVQQLVLVLDQSTSLALAHLPVKLFVINAFLCGCVCVCAHFIFLNYLQYCYFIV